MNITEECLSVVRKNLATLQEELKEAEADHRAATNARFGNGEVEPKGYDEKPHAPRRTATVDEVKAYEVAKKEWARKFPLTAAVESTEARERQLLHSVWQTKQQVEHFETLLGWKLLGKALIEEVVV
jgi:hypothetical protein